MNNQLQKLIDTRCVPEPNTGCLLWEGGLSHPIHGYPEASLGSVKRRLHREVLERKLKRKLRKGEVARHLCGVPICLEESHLEPGSPADNSADMVAMKRQAHGEQLSAQRRGELHGNAKINEKIVIQIREMYAEGGLTLQQIADFFSLTISGVHGIVKQRTWRHVK